MFLFSLISWPGMIDNDPDIGVCMSWEEENPPEDIPPVSCSNCVRPTAWQFNTLLPNTHLYSCMPAATPMQSEYHIVYFGKPVSRAWVEADDVAPFSEDCPEAEVCDTANLPSLILSCVQDGWW